jgi:DNA-directed RNA polymerase subunit RPC12/RpoP
MTESITCPHCKERITIIERPTDSGSYYSGTGTVTRPTDKFIAVKEQSTTIRWGDKLKKAKHTMSAGYCTNKIGLKYQ